MKKTFRILAILLSISFCQQQLAAQSVGIGTPTPQSSAILELSSIEKGFLLPRMTRDQRNGIPFPVTGLLIYQTDFNSGFYYYLNGWQPLGSGAGASGAANITLSNLSEPTAVNASLLPASAATYNLGSASQTWRDIYYFGDIYLQGTRLLTNRATNMFLGLSAGNTGITGSFNTAVGSNTMQTNTTGWWNTALGYQSLYTTNDGYSNTAIGYNSMFNNTTGSSNIAIGESAGSYQRTGSGNTYIGTSSNSPLNTNYNNATAIGYNAIVNASNTVVVGNTSVTSIGGQVGWTTLSDARMKRNVQENVPGLAFISQLRPVTYNLDVEAIEAKLHPSINGESITTKKSASLVQADKQAMAEKSAIIYSGFLAQEVAATAKRLGYNFSGVDAPKNAENLYGLRYAEFVVPLVKAVQELNQKVERLEGEKKQSISTNVSLEKTVAQQQEEINALKKMVLEMKQKMDAK